jgi:hypothetical protein
MANGDLLRVLRILVPAVDRFVKVAAKHRRIEPERQALMEALTDAQLVLSLQERKPLAEVRSLKPRENRKTSGKSQGRDRR